MLFIDQKFMRHYVDPLTYFLKQTLKPKWLWKRQMYNKTGSALCTPARRSKLLKLLLLKSPQPPRKKLLSLCSRKDRKSPLLPSNPPQSRDRVIWTRTKRSRLLGAPWEQANHKLALKLPKVESQLLLSKPLVVHAARFSEDFNESLKNNI